MPNDLLADEIFADAVDAYHNLGTQGSEPPVDDSAKDAPDTQDPATSPEKQVVDPKGQGDVSSKPVTPDEQAAKKESEDGQNVDGKKPKVDGAAEARKWGEQWKVTAEENDRKFKETEKLYNDAKPLLDAVENDFGGANNLKLAAELYGGIADASKFDPESAVEFLSENFPEQSKALTKYIGSELVQRATDTAIQRTFGRQLQDGEIKAVRDFLAAGKPANAQNLESFFKTNDIPDELKVDAEGNALPDHVIDYMRRQNAEIEAVKSQTEALSKSIDGAKSEQQQTAAAEAIDHYVMDVLTPIADKIVSLKLDQPIEGETPEIKEFREECSSLLDAYTLTLANKDAAFKGLYTKALNAVTVLSANPKDRVAKATIEDSSVRLKAMLGTFAGKAAKFITPLVNSLGAERAAQVKKVQDAPKDLDSPALNSNDIPKERPVLDDPFDDVNDVVRDKIRRGEIKVR